MEIGKTGDPFGAPVDAQEPRARQGFDAYAEPRSSYTPPRSQALNAGGIAQFEPAAAAPAAVPVTAGANSILSSFVAADPVSVRLLQDIRGIAGSASTVLIRGDSGTGKDLLASVLHFLGPQAGAPLVRMECASLPRELLESELFGSESPQVKIGRLEMAGAGTIVLDEIAALPMPMQAKLLRVIDEKRFERVGGVRSIEARARVIALTSVDLEYAVSRRTFREDLYYRLNVIPVVVPSLRDRPGDIRPLAEFFLARLSDMHRKPRLSFAPAAVAALERYSYPGEVRELRTIVERAIVSGVPPELLPQDLPLHIRAGAPAHKLSLEDVERAYIAEVLTFTQGKKTQAAKILGISRKTLLEKRKRYGLE